MQESSCLNYDFEFVYMQVNIKHAQGHLEDLSRRAEKLEEYVSTSKYVTRMLQTESLKNCLVKKALHL